MIKIKKIKDKKLGVSSIDKPILETLLLIAKKIKLKSMLLSIKTKDPKVTISK